MSRKWLIILMTLVLFGFLLFPCFTDSVFNRVRVQNGSLQRIIDLRIDVWSQSLHRKDIPSGRHVAFRFRTEYGDSGLTVTAKLGDGTVLSNSDGYVTGGDPFRVKSFEVTVHPDSIEIKQDQ
jgi:hypothetical protein